MHYILEEFNIVTSFIFIGRRIQRRQVPLRRQQPRKDGRRNRRIRQSSRRQENRSAARSSHHRTGESSPTCWFGIEFVGLGRVCRFGWIFNWWPWQGYILFYSFDWFSVHEIYFFKLMCGSHWRYVQFASFINVYIFVKKYLNFNFFWSLGCRWIDQRSCLGHGVRRFLRGHRPSLPRSPGQLKLKLVDILKSVDLF